MYTTNIHSSVKLGKKVYLGANVDVRNNVIIDDYSYCSNGCVIFSKTQIGKYCSIGYNVQIGPPEHPVGFISTSPYIYRHDSICEFCDWPPDDVLKPVVIGNDVWIGSNSIILQGVEISDGAIIAAGAVVTKNVPPYCIVGGVPAKVIKYRFNEYMISKLLAFQFWNHDISDIRQFIEDNQMHEWERR